MSADALPCALVTTDDRESSCLFQRVSDFSCRAAV